MMRRLKDGCLQAVYVLRVWLGCKILGHIMGGWDDALCGAWQRRCLYCGKTERKTYAQAVHERNQRHF